jgi:Fe-S cluster assembly protein SufD
MSQAVKDKSIYADAFREFVAARAGEPSWVARLREGAFGRFEELGFPTTDEEDWKYTNVAPIARKAFRPAVEKIELEGDAVERFVSAEARRSRLVFINGVYSQEHSLLEAIPPGVLVEELGAALAGGRGEVLWNHLGRLSGEGSDAFTALNTAFLGGGALLHVPKGAVVEAPVQLLFVTAPGGSESATFPRVLVVAERDSRLDLIETHAAVGDAEYFTDAVVEVGVGEGARVTHYKVQDESDSSYHVASTRAEVSKDGAYDLTTVTLGARLSRHNIEVELVSPGAECHVDGLYLVGDGQHADTHSLIDHREPYCASRQTYKGILDGKSRAVFNGRVYVHEGARGTDAQQSNKIGRAHV